MANAKVIELPLSEVKLHPVFDMRDEKITEDDTLLLSMKEHGLIHWPTLRPIEGGKELVSGYRRFKRAQKLGWKKTNFNLREMDDKTAMSIALSENAERKDLTPMEEARVFKAAIEKVGMKTSEISAEIKKSDAFVSNRLRLLELDKDVQELLHQGKIKPGHAEHGLFLLEGYPKLQKGLVKSIVKQNMTKEDAKDEAKSMLHEQKARDEFEAARKAAKFKNCPKCGRKATRFAWSDKSKFMCENNDCHPKGSQYSSTEWSPKTGKVLNEQEEHPGIKAAQEARQRMEAPRTAYFGTTLEKTKKIAHKKAMELLKRADPLKGRISLYISKQGSYDGTKIEIDDKVEISAHVLGSATFQVEKRDGFVKTFIPFNEPKKKDYATITKFLDYPEQLTHSGNPVNKPIGAPETKKGKKDEKRVLKRRGEPPISPLPMGTVRVKPVIDLSKSKKEHEEWFGDTEGDEWKDIDSSPDSKICRRYRMIVQARRVRHIKADGRSMVRWCVTTNFPSGASSGYCNEDEYKYKIHPATIIEDAWREAERHVVTATQDFEPKPIRKVLVHDCGKYYELLIPEKSSKKDTIPHAASRPIASRPPAEGNPPTTKTTTRGPAVLPHSKAPASSSKTPLHDLLKSAGNVPLVVVMRCGVCHRPVPVEKDGKAFYDFHMQDKHGWMWSNKEQKYVDPEKSKT